MSTVAFPIKNIDPLSVSEDDFGDEDKIISLELLFKFKVSIK
jgi:hypothetical protein